MSAVDRAGDEPLDDDLADECKTVAKAGLGNVDVLGWMSDHDPIAVLLRASVRIRRLRHELAVAESQRVTDVIQAVLDAEAAFVAADARYADAAMHGSPGDAVTAERHWLDAQDARDDAVSAYLASRPS